MNETDGVRSVHARTRPRALFLRGVGSRSLVDYGGADPLHRAVPPSSHAGARELIRHATPLLGIRFTPRSSSFVLYPQRLKHRSFRRLTDRPPTAYRRGVTPLATALGRTPTCPPLTVARLVIRTLGLPPPASTSWGAACTRCGASEPFVVARLRSRYDGTRVRMNPRTLRT